MHFLVKNFVSLSGAEIFAKLVTFAAFSFLARLLGPAGFGYIEWTGTALMCASLVIDQGFSSYGAREIAKNPSDTQKLVNEVVTARFLLAIIAYALIALFTFWFVREQIVRQLLLTYGLSLWALPFLLQWVFQGHDQMHLVGIVQVIRQSVFAITIFIFIRNSSDLLWVGAAEVAGVTTAGVFCVWIYHRYFANHLRFKPRLTAKLFREGMPIGLSQMFWTLKMFGAVFILGLVASAEDIGYFAGAMRIYIALHTFVWLYYFNMLPSLSRSWRLGADHFARLIRRSLITTLTLGILGTVIWIAAAPFVITSVFGDTFAPAAAALQWLAGACFAAAISGHYRYGLIAAGQQGKELFVTALSAALAVALIPLGYFKFGITGSAAALVLAEFMALASSWLIARHSIFGKSGNNLRLSGSPQSIPEASL